MFWKVTLFVIVRKNAHRNMCLIVSGYRDRAVYIYILKASLMVKEKEKSRTVSFILILS
jgi:hypothetical protein